MSFKPPYSPASIATETISQFSGIAGKRIEVLRIYNSKGHNISSGFANEQIDVDAAPRGQLVLRPGMKKTALTGGTASVRAIFEIRLGGQNYYAINSGGSVQLIELPRYAVPKPIKLPVEPALPADYPTTFPPLVPNPNPNKAEPYAPKNDDVPKDDVSVPPAAESCEYSFEFTGSPESMTFEMQEGGDLPATQKWWCLAQGWYGAKNGLFVFIDSTSWINSLSHSVFVQPVTLGRCWIGQMGYINVGITVEAIGFGAGSYSGTVTHRPNLGPTDTLTLPVTLNVYKDPTTITNLCRRQWWYDDGYFISTSVNYALNQTADAAYDFGLKWAGAGETIGRKSGQWILNLGNGFFNVTNPLFGQDINGYDTAYHTANPGSTNKYNFVISENQPISTTDPNPGSYTP